MQVVEDGTLSSLIVRLPLHFLPLPWLSHVHLQPFIFITLAIFGITTYIAFDIALTVTQTFGPSVPPQALHSLPLFVLTSVWPGA